MNKPLKELEDRIGYRFKNQELFCHAMRHSSYINEKKMDKTDCNERLEFLGDAVLELITSDFLYRNYPKDPEGKMTRFRASIVCEPTLAFCAEAIQLGSYLLLGKGEEATGGRKRDSVVSDAMEALIGAIYLDGGFTNAKEFVETFILNDLEHKKLFFDSKTILQEEVQSWSKIPLVYELTGEEGPDHDKKFTVLVSLDGKVLGRGTGKTKKHAEQLAAYEALLSMRDQGET